MARLLTCSMVALVMAAACNGHEPRTIASSDGAHDRDVIPLLADISGTTTGPASPMIVSTLDGSVQEEVVYADAPLSPSTDAEVVEVPEIIADALRDAPATTASERQVIVKSVDGSVQEEVVFVSSDDELGAVGETQHAPNGEDSIATLHVPAAL